MEVTLQITTRDMPHSEALENYIREKIEKLKRFYPHIMSCLSSSNFRTNITNKDGSLMCTST